MLDLESALVAIEAGALMAGLSLLGFGLGELFPVLRRSLRSSFFWFSVSMLVIPGAVAAIDRWHPNPLAVLEIAGLLGVLGVLGLVLTQVIPPLRRRSGRWPPVSM